MSTVWCRYSCDSDRGRPPVTDNSLSVTPSVHGRWTAGPCNPTHITPFVSLPRARGTSPDYCNTPNDAVHSPPPPLMWTSKSEACRGPVLHGVGRGGAGPRARAVVRGSAEVPEGLGSKRLERYASVPHALSLILSHARFRLFLHDSAPAGQRLTQGLTLRLWPVP